MQMDLFSTLILGFVLGIKHSFEPDHIIAVSTLASKTKKIWNTSLTGVFWGIGHTATLFITGLLLIGFKLNLPEKWALTLEMFVGFMLVYLGLKAILSWKSKLHQHFNEKHTYLNSVFIGFIHGLAGSSAMVILTMNMIDTIWQGAIYIFVFGIGTCFGMLLFTILLGIPFNVMKTRRRINKFLIQITGGISTAFGFYYIFNLGIMEGLFALWF